MRIMGIGLVGLNLSNGYGFKIMDWEKWNAKTIEVITITIILNNNHILIAMLK